MAKSLIEERVRADSNESPYEDHHADSGYSDLTSGADEGFSRVSKNEMFGGYLPTNLGHIGDTMDFWYGNSTYAGQYWINNWYSYEFLGEYHHTWNTSFSGGNDNDLEPYGVMESGGKFFVHDADHIILPNGDRSYGITLFSNKTKSGQIYTKQYHNSAGHMIAATRGQQTYKVSFYAKIPRPYYIGSNSGTSSPIFSVQFNPAGDGPTVGGTQLRSEFENTYASNTAELACGGEIDVWFWVATSGYNSFGTGYPYYSGLGGNGSNNQYKRAYNGDHCEITFQEAAYMRLNGFESYLSPYGLQQTSGTALTRYWQYFEFTVTIADDNSAQSGAYTPRFIAARIDQNKKGDQFNNPYDSHDHYNLYPGVTIANFSIEPRNVSMIKTDTGFNTEYTPAHNHTGTVTLGSGTQEAYGPGQTTGGGLTYQV